MKPSRGEADASARPKARTRLLNLLKALVTLVLLGVVATTVDLRRVGQALFNVRWSDLLLAFFLYQLGILVRAYRWQALLRGQGVKASLSRLVDLYYVGTFFNSFLPSGFGGDVVRVLEVLQDGTQGGTAVSTVLVDRLMGLEVLLVMALCALPFCWHIVPWSAATTVLALLGGTTLALCALLSQRLAESLMQRSKWVRKALGQKLGNAPASWAHYEQRALLRASGASLVFNLLLILAQALLGRAVGVRIALGYFFVFVPIISALLTLPISISGFGVREGGYVLLFGQAGVGAGEATAMSLLFYGLNLATGLVGAGLYLWQALTGRRPRPHSRQSPHGMVK